VELPDAEDVRAQSPLLTAAYPVDDDPEAAAALEALTGTVAVLVGSMTCRGLVTDQPGDAVPEYLESLVVRALVLKAEQWSATGGTAALRRRGITDSNLSSISAGPWSESYFGLDEAIKAKQLDPDRAIHELLWAIATQECREAWLALWSGEHAPASVIQSFEWGARPNYEGPGAVW